MKVGFLIMDNPRRRGPAGDATRSSGVRIAIRTKIVNALMSLPQVVNDRLMILKIDLCMLQP